MRFCVCIDYRRLNRVTLPAPASQRFILHESKQHGVCMTWSKRHREAARFWAFGYETLLLLCWEVLLCVNLFPSSYKTEIMMLTPDQSTWRSKTIDILMLMPDLKPISGLWSISKRPYSSSNNSTRPAFMLAIQREHFVWPKSNPLILVERKFFHQE